MHSLDIAIVIILAGSALMGARSGLINQVIRLCTYVAAVYGSIYLHKPVADWLQDNLTGSLSTESAPFAANALAYVVSFPLLFAGLVLATHFARQFCRTAFRPSGSPEMQLVAQTMFPSLLNRALGAVVSTVMMALTLGAALAALALVPMPQLEAKLAGSHLRLPLVQAVQTVIVAIPQKDKDALTEAIARLTSKGSSMGGEFLGQGLQGVSGELNNLSNRLDQLQSASNPSEFSQR